MQYNNDLERDLDRESMLACGIIVALIMCCSFGFMIGYALRLVMR